MGVKIQIAAAKTAERKAQPRPTGCVTWERHDLPCGAAGDGDYIAGPRWRHPEARESRMRGFLIRMLINAAGIWLASEIVPGIRVSGTSTLLAAAIVLGIVNALVRPLAVVLTFPITVVSLGFFLLFINAAMLGLVANLVSEFHVRDFGSAFLGALIVSLCGWATSHYIGPRGTRIEVIEYRSRH